MKGKHKGDYNTYLEKRDKEFLLAYRKATADLLKENGHFRHSEALDIARCTPTSRYFVSEQRAQNIMKKLDGYYALARANSMKRKRLPPFPLAGFTYQRQRMYTHMYIDFCRLRDENPKLSNTDLIFMTCALPSREFYMNLNSASTILGRIRMNMKKYGRLISRNPNLLKRDMEKGDTL